MVIELGPYLLPRGTTMLMSHMMEGVLLLSTIAQKWRLRLVPGHPVKPQPLITLRPKHGMQMTLERRG